MNKTDSEKHPLNRIRVHHAPQLARLFKDAMNSSFGYLPAGDRDKIIKQNRAWRLAIASLRPRRVLIGVFDEGQLAGYVIGSIPADGVGQIYWLYVKPQYRGQNLGLKLLSRALRDIERGGASKAVLATHDLRSYYQRQGFKPAGKAVINKANMELLVYKFGGHGE